jgi:hypothetical protein
MKEPKIIKTNNIENVIKWKFVNYFIVLTRKDITMIRALIQMETVRGDGIHNVDVY